MDRGENEELDHVSRELREQVGGELRLGAEEDGRFQVAEALAIAAVMIVLLAAVLAILEVAGLDTIGWLRDQLNPTT